MWGKNIADLKVNTNSKKPIHLTWDIVIIIKKSVKLHKDLFMIADIFFINGITRFIYLGRNIIFIALIYLSDRKSIAIFKAFKQIYMYYSKHGFGITTLHVDGEFAPLQALIHKIPGGLRVSPSSSSEHVPDIDRIIGVVSLRIRFIRHSLTFNKFPKIFLIHLVFQSIKIMEHFPVKGFISDTIIPTTIMTGDILHYRKNLVYRLYIIVKNTSKALRAIAINHVLKVPYAWDQAKIYKAGSSLWSWD